MNLFYCPALHEFLSFLLCSFYSICKNDDWHYNLVWPCYDRYSDVGWGTYLREPLKPCQTLLSINVIRVSVTTCPQILNKLRLCFGKNRITLVSEREMLPYHRELQWALACWVPGNGQCYWNFTFYRTKITSRQINVLQKSSRCLLFWVTTHCVLSVPKSKVTLTLYNQKETRL